eukprot:7194778-Ditylum_brightwellii.AAC.1
MLGGGQYGHLGLVCNAIAYAVIPATTPSLNRRHRIPNPTSQCHGQTSPSTVQPIELNEAITHSTNFDCY